MNALTVIGVAALVLVGGDAAAKRVVDEQMGRSAQAGAEAVLEGTLEVIIEDSNQGSRTLYFLVDRGRRVTLRFRSAPPNVSTGTRVRVRGRWEADDILAVTAFERI